MASRWASRQTDRRRAVERHLGDQVIDARHRRLGGSVTVVEPAARNVPPVDQVAGVGFQADPERLWGKPIITSPVIAQGTVLVGNFQVGATVWDRESARITFTESGLADAGAGSELFTRNQIRFRAEERIAFGVERPAAFTEVTGF